MIEWTGDDLSQLATIANATTLAILDLGSEQPGAWVRAADVYERAGVTSASGSGQLGGFGLTTRSRFRRSNPPYERQWGPGGEGGEAYYRVSSELADVWRGLRESAI